MTGHFYYAISSISTFKYTSCFPPLVFSDTVGCEDGLHHSEHESIAQWGEWPPGLTGEKAEQAILLKEMRSTKTLGSAFSLTNSTSAMSQDSSVLEIWQEETWAFKEFYPQREEEELRQSNDNGSSVTAWQNHAKIYKERAAGFPWATNHSPCHCTQGRQMLSWESSDPL